MNKITKKLMLSLLTVILAIGALGTTTFAWFTLTNVAKVDEFQAEIQGDYGIEISLDGNTWENVITQEDIKAKIFSAFGEGYQFKFNHITSTDAINFSSINANHQVTAADQSLKNKSYLEFELYFRSTDKTHINLTEIYLFGGADFAWNVDTNFSVGGIDYKAKDGDTDADQIWVNPINAVRIALVQTIEVEDDDIVTKKVYELDDIEEASEVAPNMYMNTSPDFDNNTAIQYYNAKNNTYPGKPADGQPHTTTLVGTTPITLNENNRAILEVAKQMVITLNEVKEDNNRNYNVGKVVIRVWIEGFDSEAFNAILGKQVTFSLRFEGRPIE